VEQSAQEVVTGEAVVLDLPCARFPTRMLAHLIDMLVQVPALGIVFGLIFAAAGSHALDTATTAALSVTGYVLVIVGYPVIFETLSRGKTLGKLALGLRVVGDDGSPERFRQALVRGLAGAVECWILIGVPALIASMASQRAKRLGDLFAGTFALRERAPRAHAMVPLPDPRLSGWATSLQLSALPEPLAAAAASYLSRYWELDARVRDQLGWQLAADIAARVSPPPPPGMPPVHYLGLVLAERRNRDLRRYAPPPAR
jgi:uncharacterized RDD family membrane protein YckC